jgi:type II secretory pathway component PulM
MLRDRLHALTAAFERLSGREQVMVLFLSLALFGMVLGFGGWLVNRDLEARGRRIEAKADKLREVALLRADYQRRLAEQNRLASEVRSNQGMRILTYLEDLSRRANIDLGNASERPGSPTGSDQVREEAAEVAIKKVSLDRLYEFLRQIEEGNQLVKVRQLKVQQNFEARDMLDANITVGTFKPGS